MLGQTTKTQTFSVKKDKEEFFLGAGVAKHLKKLGSNVIFTTVVGNDKLGKVISELKKNKIKTNCLMTRASTTLKERFWAENHKLLQVDIVDNHIISKNIENKISKIVSNTDQTG